MTWLRFWYWKCPFYSFASYIRSKNQVALAELVNCSLNPDLPNPFQSWLTRLPYYTMLYYTILYYTTPYYPILCYAMLCYAVLCYAILYYTILYYTTILLYYYLNICSFVKQNTTMKTQKDIIIFNNLFSKFLQSQIKIVSLAADFSRASRINKKVQKCMLLPLLTGYTEMCFLLLLFKATLNNNWKRFPSKNIQF